MNCVVKCCLSESRIHADFTDFADLRATCWHIKAECAWNFTLTRGPVIAGYPRPLTHSLLSFSFKQTLYRQNRYRFSAISKRRPLADSICANRNRLLMAMPDVPNPERLPEGIFEKISKLWYTIINRGLHQKCDRIFSYFCNTIR